MYTAAAILKEKQAVLGFLDFYLKNTQKLSKEVGYVSLPANMAPAVPRVPQRCRSG